ncbi:MAG: RCC1 domain-containing protein [Succinivibrionaceae bacterium]
MRYRKTTLSTAIFLAISFLSTGCGGGSSSGSSNEGSSGDNATKTKALNVQIIDGYLKDSKVCADINRNYFCDPGEPDGITDEFGKVTLDVPENVLNENNSIKVLSHTRKGSGNKILGKDSVTDRDIVLTANIFINNGEFKNENKITPFTTLVDSTFKQQDIKDLKEELYQEVIGKLAETLGLKKELIDHDYNDPHAVSENPDLLKNLVAGEIIVRNDLIPKSLDDAKNTTEEASQTTESISNNVVEYKEIVEDIVKNTDGEDVENIGNIVSNKIEETVAKLGTSFRTITGGDADEWRCGVTRSNNVFCWGNNSSGILGDPDLYRYDEETKLPLNGWKEVDLFSAKPVAVKINEKNADGSYKLLENVKNLSAGNGHACAVTNNGEVYCWGQNFHGQLGNDQIGKTEDGTGFGLLASRVVKGEQNKDDTSVNYLNNIESVTLAHNVSCALTRDGEAYCWGDNTAKQLGGDHKDAQTEPYRDVLSKEGISMYGFIKSVPHPVKVQFPEEVKKVTKLISGIWAYCAIAEVTDITDEPNLYCWGDDTRGLVTHNWEQYIEDFRDRYEGKLLTQDGTKPITDYEPWTWHIYEESNEWYPLYSVPVTKIKFDKELNKIEFDLKDIDDFKISGFDSNLLFVDEKNGYIYSNYCGGSEDKTAYWTVSSPERMNHEKIKKVQVDHEEKHKFILSDAGKLYSFSRYNRHGDLGNGTIDRDDVEGDEAELFPNLPVVLDADGKNALSGVVDVFTNKRSICATVAVTDVDNPDETNKVAVKYDLYCWGSTTFGQNGYDNGDNGFSYSDTSDEWDGKTDKNKYFDKYTRYDKLPKLVTFFDKE